MTAPVFVKIQKYNEVLLTVEDLMKKLGDARSALSRIYELKEVENKEIDSWKKELGNIESRLTAIREALEKPEET
jgi:predicted  nucleic acid-binding Zn-ribbon protein